MNHRTRVEPRSVMIVDDHPLVIIGISALLESSGRYFVTAQADSAQSAYAVMQAFASNATLPSVAICDLSLGTDDGLSLILQLRMYYPSVPVIALSMHDEEAYADRLVACGASGFVSKIAIGSRLLDGLDAVLRGEQFFGLTAPIAIGGGQSKSSTALLTAREAEVFFEIGRGLAVKEIAMKLNTSPKTIDTHRMSIRTKLNIRSNGELQRRATLETILS
jgi:DNA-binding NarL/FixJ family response regulator